MPAPHQELISRVLAVVCLVCVLSKRVLFVLSVHGARVFRCVSLSLCVCVCVPTPRYLTMAVSTTLYNTYPVLCGIGWPPPPPLPL